MMFFWRSKEVTEDPLPVLQISFRQPCAKPIWFLSEALAPKQSSRSGSSFQSRGTGFRPVGPPGASQLQPQKAQLLLAGTVVLGPQKDHITIAIHST